MNAQAFFFIGIGGMGMSGLAKILHSEGKKVSGSDRNLQGEYCCRIMDLGVPVFQQDGTGPEAFMKKYDLSPTQILVVKSTAVEDQVPDVVTARALGMKEIMRSDLLADMFNQKKGIAVGGTSGKTTTSGLIAWMLKFVGLEPSAAIGGIICNLETNAFLGSGPHFVIEADESDGSIVKYHSYISIITNVSRDHKTLEELMGLFGAYSNNTAENGIVILGADDPNLNLLRSNITRRVLTYGNSENADVRPQNPVLYHDRSTFSYRGIPFSITLPGGHNLNNALAGVATAEVLGISPEETAAAIHAFPGMKRRFERVGTVNGITVVDDFAHNPAEISAAIDAARATSKRRFIIYQPHGFGPTRFTHDDLVKVFSSLHSEERLYLDEIFYGGGTVEKDISSRQIIEEVKCRFPNAYFMGDRERIVEDIVREAKPGDMVLVMGARDINSICKRILERLK